MIKRKMIYVGLLLAIFTCTSFLTLPSRSDTISLHKVYIYVESIYITDAFNTGSYEFLLNIKYKRHFDTMGSIFINDDNQYNANSDFWQSSQTFDGGQTKYDYAYQSFAASYCLPISTDGNEYTIGFRVKKNVLSKQDIYLSFGHGQVYNTFFWTDIITYDKYDGALKVYMMIVLI